MKRVRKKCNRCVRGNSCHVWVRDTNYVVTFCAVCHQPMSELELMRPRMAIVSRQSTGAASPAPDAEA